MLSFLSGCTTQLNTKNAQIVHPIEPEFFISFLLKKYS